MVPGNESFVLGGEFWSPGGEFWLSKLLWLGWLACCAQPWLGLARACLAPKQAGTSSSVDYPGGNNVFFFQKMFFIFDVDKCQKKVEI